MSLDDEDEGYSAKKPSQSKSFLAATRAPAQSRSKRQAAVNARCLINISIVPESKQERDAARDAAAAREAAARAARASQPAPAKKRKAPSAGRPTSRPPRPAQKQRIVPGHGPSTTPRGGPKPGSTTALGPAIVGNTRPSTGFQYIPKFARPNASGTSGPNTGSSRKPEPRLGLGPGGRSGPNTGAASILNAGGYATGRSLLGRSAGTPSMPPPSLVPSSSSSSSSVPGPFSAAAAARAVNKPLVPGTGGGTGVSTSVSGGGALSAKMAVSSRASVSTIRAAVFAASRNAPSSGADGGDGDGGGLSSSGPRAHPLSKPLVPSSGKQPALAPLPLTKRTVVPISCTANEFTDVITPVETPVEHTARRRVSGRKAGALASARNTAMFRQAPSTMEYVHVPLPPSELTSSGPRKARAQLLGSSWDPLDPLSSDQHWILYGSPADEPEPTTTEQAQAAFKAASTPPAIDQFPDEDRLFKINLEFHKETGPYKGCGTLVPFGLKHVLSLMDLGPDSVFVDLGSGPGNVLYWALGLYHCKRVLGYERERAVVDFGLDKRHELLKEFPSFKRLELHEQDLKLMGSLPADVNRVFAYDRIMGFKTIQAMAKMLNKLQHEVILVSFKPPAVWAEAGLNAVHFGTVNHCKTTGGQNFQGNLFYVNPVDKRYSEVLKNYDGPSEEETGGGFLVTEDNSVNTGREEGDQPALSQASSPPEELAGNEEYQALLAELASVQEIIDSTDIDT